MKVEYEEALTELVVTAAKVGSQKVDIEQVRELVREQLVLVEKTKARISRDPANAGTQVTVVVGGAVKREPIATGPSRQPINAGPNRKPIRCGGSICIQVLGVRLCIDVEGDCGG